MPIREEAVVSPDESTIASAAVAIDRDKGSQFAVRWAANHLMLKDNALVLVHVCTKQHWHSQNGADMAQSHEECMQQLFLPYRGFCTRKGIRVKEVMLHDFDVARALCLYVKVNSIETIVFGAANRSAIARAFKASDVPNLVAKSVPEYCSVYSISHKGKAQMIKSSSEPVAFHNVYSLDKFSGSSSDVSQWSWKAPSPEAPLSYGSQQQRGSPDDNSGDGEHQQIIQMETSSYFGSLSSNESINMFSREKHHRVKITKPKSFFDSNAFSDDSCSTMNSGAGDGSFGHMTPVRKFPAGKINALQQAARYPNLRGRNVDSLHDIVQSCHSEVESVQSEDLSYEYLDLRGILDSSETSTASQVTEELEEELKKIKLELTQLTEKYNAACQDAVSSREEVRDIVHWKSEGARKIEEAKWAQETALAIVEREKQKGRAAIEMAVKAQRLAEMEAEKRKIAEAKFKHETQAKQKAMYALARSIAHYRRYSIEEIEAATSHFSSTNMIGEGSYGPVYKAILDHTKVAIKVLRSDVSEGQKQFHREVDVLSQMRHPNIVILLGACPEQGCLIYEFMGNGCLEDRLLCKNGSPPMTWSTRFRIAVEIATALNFLHQTRPQPLVHRDLKPANILLDKNYVSKISDVGLSRLVPPSLADTVTQYHMTVAAGTFCYIDPEYQQTGMLGTKSDIYSLGIILLQIVTARPPMGLMHLVECAIENGTFTDVLDPTVLDWPIDSTLSFAKLALKCCELRKRDRPDLDSVILPELKRLRDIGS